MLTAILFHSGAKTQHSTAELADRLRIGEIKRIQQYNRNEVALTAVRPVKIGIFFLALLLKREK